MIHLQGEGSDGKDRQHIPSWWVAATITQVTGRLGLCEYILLHVSRPDGLAKAATQIIRAYGRIAFTMLATHDTKPANSLTVFLSTQCRPIKAFALSIIALTFVR